MRGRGNAAEWRAIAADCAPASAALAAPIDSPPLTELAQPGDRVCIVFTDATRSSPDALVVPPVLRALEQAGVRDEVFPFYAERSRAGAVDFLQGARLQIDEPLMDELGRVKSELKPQEILFVADSMTGQDAVHTAENFDNRIGITGVVLTRMDGDGRGGAALSMRAVTGKPIKFVGLGEKMDALEEFHPERVAGRILGMGDIVSLVEKAQEQIEAAEAERMMKRFQKGRFDMNDMMMQFEQMQNMGGMGGLIDKLPGMGGMADADPDGPARERALRPATPPRGLQAATEPPHRHLGPPGHHRRHVRRPDPARRLHRHRGSNPHGGQGHAAGRRGGVLAVVHLHVPAHRRDAPSAQRIRPIRHRDRTRAHPRAGPFP